MVIILIKEKKSHYLSLRWILLGTYFLVGIIPLLLITSTILHSMREYFVEERKKELLSQANIISGQITANDYLVDKENRSDLEVVMLDTSQKNNFRVLVLDSSCVVIYDTGYQSVGKTILVPEVIEALENKDVAREQPDSMIYAAASIVASQNTRTGVVLISGSLQDIDIRVSEIAHKGNILMAVIAVIMVIVMFIVSKIFTEPIKRVIRVIQQMSEGHFEKRAVVSSTIHNEIVDLALACNQMADKLERVETTRQQFVSDVSHELKTPLSSVKVLSDSIMLQEDVPKEMYVEFLHDISSEVDRMTEIINDLLSLVKLDQKENPLNFAEHELGNMLDGIFKRMLPLAKQKNIHIQLTKVREIYADVDGMKLTLAISNLIDNAIKYTPEEGEVSVTLDGDHQHAFITVTDSGIGIPEDEIPHIFERFYRVDKTRDRETGGTGLGLSITHATIMMHKGSIKVNSKENEGTTLQLRIPLKQSAQEK